MGKILQIIMFTLKMHPPESYEKTIRVGIYKYTVVHLEVSFLSV